jgi:hypothetical protein
MKPTIWEGFIMKPKLLVLNIILIMITTLLAACTVKVQLPGAKGSGVTEDILGKWSYYYDAGVNGQSLGELEFKKNGTFSFVMAIAVSSGSGITSKTYGVAASSQGKYKITGENKILLYNIRGRRCEEDSSKGDLYEIIKKTYSIRDVAIEDREFEYSVENSNGEMVITLEPLVEKEPDKLGFGLLTSEYPLTLVK